MHGPANVDLVQFRSEFFGSESEAWRWVRQDSSSGSEKDGWRCEKERTVNNNRGRLMGLVAAIDENGKKRCLFLGFVWNGEIWDLGYSHMLFSRFFFFFFLNSPFPVRKTGFLFLGFAWNSWFLREEERNLFLGLVWNGEKGK